MKKKMIILLVVILIIIVCACIFFFLKNEPEMKWYKNEDGESLIEVENLRITVKGFYQDEISDEQFSSLQIDEGTIQNIKRQIEGEGFYTLIEMSRTDNKELVEPNIDYMVYDNNKSIIANSIIYKIDAKTNSFITKFVKEQYNSSKLPNDELASHTIHASWSLVPVWSDESSILFMIAAKKGEYKSYGGEKSPEPVLDLSKIHVLVVNPSYKDIETKEKVELENTVFEFEL